MKITILILISFIFARCVPGQLIGSGYLVTATKSLSVEAIHFNTSTGVDQYLLSSTGINFNTDSLIGRKKPYFEFRNDNWVIYVEKQLTYRLPSGKIRNKPFNP